MTTLPMFPLNIVAFPNENLNLHIFEPRYKQLIQDCREEGLTFGILPVINKRPVKIGTEIKLKEVTNTYSNGSMDIKTEGMRVFKILEFSQVMKGKLYPGGIVEYLEDDMTSDELLKVDVLKIRKELYLTMRLDPTLEKPSSSIVSYDIAHKIGLSLKQEVELLRIRVEKDRLEFIYNHLNRILPSVINIEDMKRKVKLNGHFKDLKPPI